MNRPMGVTILGWVAIVFGAFGLIASIMGVVATLGFLALGAGAAGLGAVASGAALAGSAILLLALAVWTAVLCAIEIAFGVGALQLKPWAWTLGMVWTWVSVATNILSLIASRGSGIFGSLLGIIIALGILYYLYTDEVRAAFGKTDQVPPSFMVPVFAQIDNMVASSKNSQRPPQAPTGYPPTPPMQGPGGYQPPQAPAHYEATPPAPSASPSDIPPAPRV